MKKTVTRLCWYLVDTIGQFVTVAVDFKFIGEFVEISGDGSRLDTALTAASIGHLILTDANLPHDGSSTVHQGMTLPEQGPHGWALAWDAVPELDQTGLHLIDELPDNFDTTTFGLNQLRQRCTGEIDCRIQLGSGKILTEGDSGVIMHGFGRLGSLVGHGCRDVKTARFGGGVTSVVKRKREVPSLGKN